MAPKDKKSTGDRILSKNTHVSATSTLSNAEMQKKLIDELTRMQSIADRHANELEVVISSINDPLLIYNKDAIVIKANAAAVNNLGFDPCGLSQDKICEKVYFRDLNNKRIPFNESPVISALQGQTINNGMYRYRNFSGLEIVSLSSASPIWNKIEIIGAVLIWHDITEIKEREVTLQKEHDDLELRVSQRTAALLESHKKLAKEIADRKRIEHEMMKTHELLERIFNNTLLNIAYLDVNFNFIRVNAQYAAYSGRSPEFFVGKNHFDLYPHTENQAIFRNVLKTKQPFVVFARPFVHPDKSDEQITYWDWTLQPILSIDGDVEGLLLILNDVTERVKAEIKLNETREEIERNRRLSDIGALAATVAHELRNPLGVIRTAVYNVRRKNDNPGIIKHLDNIDKKISDSELIINNLLSYSRLKPPQFKKIKIHDIVKDFINSSSARFNQPSISVVTNLSSIENVICEVDPLQIGEIINNILNNSFQAISHDHGIIRIEAECCDKTLVKISVSDNGDGIAKDDLDKIFNPFFTSKTRGTGLGLTLCRKIAHLHLGEISVESEQGRGTTVSLTLPALRTSHETNTDY